MMTSTAAIAAIVQATSVQPSEIANASATGITAAAGAPM
jgi:hypothetical protein